MKVFRFSSWQILCDYSLKVYVCQKVDWRHRKCEGSVKQNQDLLKWSLKSSMKFARQFIDSRSSKIMEPWFLFLYARHTLSLSLSLSLKIAYKFVRGGNFIEEFHNFEATMEWGKNGVCWDSVKNLDYNGFVYSNSSYLFLCSKSPKKLGTPRVVFSLKSFS